MTWIQFRPQLPAGMDSQLMDAEMLAMFCATGWNGDISLAGLTVPNWFVPILSIALAGFALMRAADVFEAPRGLVIAFATYCMVHLGFLTVIVVIAGGDARLGLGAMLGVLASIAAFVASLMRDESAQEASDPVRVSTGGNGGYGRVIGAPRQGGSVEDVPTSREFHSPPHQRT